MRHGQQLQLIEKFKNECKAGGYTPIEGLKMHDGHVEPSNEVTMARQRRDVFRWVRSSLTSDNSSASDVATASHHFDQADATDDDFGGKFHAPATLPNDYLEAICGNLTLT